MLKHVLLVCSLIFSPLAFADWKPTKSVEVIVPFPPGSGNDLVIRPLVEKIEKNTGVKFLVVNKPGAGGTVGTTHFSKMEKDNHSIAVLSIGGLSAMDKTFPSFAKEAPYTLNSFEYVMPVGTSPVVVIANKNDKVNTPKELLDVVMKDNVVVADSGGGGRLGLESFLIHSQARVKNNSIVRVEHKGPAETVTDVIGGHVRFGTVPLTVAYPHVKSGNLKIIAATQQQPVAQLNIASMSSISQNISAEIVWGVVMNKGTSKEVVGWYAAELLKAINDADVEKIFTTNMFFKPNKNIMSPDKFKQYVYDQEKLHQPVVQFILNSAK